MTLKGRLENFGLGELLQTLALNQHTGTLVLTSPEGSKQIYFSTGSITLSSSAQSVRIGEILLRQGKISPNALDEAERIQHTTGKLFGQIFIDAGYVDEADIQFALRQKVEEEIYDVFLWTSGEFEFKHDYCPPELMDPLQKLTQVSIEPSTVIMEGLRQLDEYQIISKAIPNQKAFVKRAIQDLPEGIEISNDEMCVWIFLESPRQIESIVGASALSRFQALSTTHKLLQRGWIRHLDFDEHRELAQAARKSGDPETAVGVYGFLAELETAEAQQPDFLKEASELLIESGDRVRGLRMLERSVFRFLERNDANGAWLAGLRLMSAGTPSVDVLRTLWQIRPDGLSQELQTLFENYVSVLLEASEFGELQRLVEASEDLFGLQACWWAARGECYRGSNDVIEAVESFEQAAELFVRDEEYRDAIKAFRAVYDLDPYRDDIADRLKKLLSTQEKIERRKHNRFTLAGMLLIVASVISAFPLVYELRARELFDQTQTLATAYALDRLAVDEDSIRVAVRQEQAFESKQIDAVRRVREQYQRVVDEYSLSTRARKAKEELEDLDAYESAIAKAMKVEKDRRLEEESARIESVRSRISELESKRDELLARGDFVALRRIHEQLLEESRSPRGLRSRVEFCLRIDTIPSGGQIFREETLIGVAPQILSFAPDARFDVRIERKGCLSQYVKIDERTDVDLKVRLDRVPLQRIRFPAIDGTVLSDAERFLVPSRDGRVYSLLRHQLFAEIASWTRGVGSPGHPTPSLIDIGAHVVVVTLDGTIERIDRVTGHAEWTTELRTPITTDGSIDARGTFVAVGTEDAEVIVISLRDGVVRQRTNLTYPIIDVRYVAGALEVIDATGRWTTLDPSNLEARDSRRVSASVSTLTADGKALDRHGRLWSRNSTYVVWPTPTTRIVERDGRLLYGTSNGSEHAWTIVEADGTLEVTQIPIQPSSAPYLVGKSVLLSSVDGYFYCFDLDGTVKFKLDIDAEICDVVPGSDSDYVVFLTAGGVLKIEGESKP